MQRYDVVIIGGGLYGTSTAFHLLKREPGLAIAIVEPDPGYEHAASARSNGGVRILFSQAESIAMSQYGHAFYADFPSLMAVDAGPAELALHRHGYLLMATHAQQVADMEANLEQQRAYGCRVDFYDGDSLRRHQPHLRTEDVIAAVKAPDDMWIDPYGAVTSLMRKVREMGATLIRARATGLEHGHARIDAVQLDDGSRLGATHVVNCAGAWAPPICAMAGFTVPVQPMPMMVFYFECQSPVEGFGVTIDIGTVSFRPEGAGFISINRRVERTGEFCWEADESLFEAENWPRLAHRVPAFEAIRLKSSYCCHYAYNFFDGNIVIGAWPGGPENFLFATGASGHGLQHAPAAGRGLAELILDGAYTTVDLTRFGARRIVEERPDPERGFVA